MAFTAFRPFPMLTCEGMSRQYVIISLAMVMFLLMELCQIFISIELSLTTFIAI